MTVSEINYTCNLCPRGCNAQRTEEAGNGFCMMPSLPVLARAGIHFWEEPCISGASGSGTVFFSGCSLKCVYCQNYGISHENIGLKISVERLAEIFDELHAQGVNNINLVNPTHYIYAICEAVDIYKSWHTQEGDAPLPIVYNSSGYERTESLKLLEGKIDIYLPDIKYYDDENAVKFSGAKNYFKYTSAAVKEMYRQVGGVKLDENGIAQKGLIVRHLILPRAAKQSIAILDFIKSELPDDVYVSLMAQYTPMGRAKEYKELSRRINSLEYEKVLNHMTDIGLNNGYVQSMKSASEEYVPEFDFSGVIRRS